MTVVRDSHPEDLKAELRKKFGSLQHFETEYGLRPNSAAAGLRRPYEQVERAVAEALDRPASQIWPSRYAEDGERFSPQPTRNYAPARGKAWPMTPQAAAWAGGGA
ncbi:helix-turn-helix domain-containing protein [Sphingomonas sp. SRS2]|uniref:helix-turn-helix domain-containing protein n=1 Tax=Sphingomonas sp. SRS2 TaxID=133190 RepID=UPI0006184841|nr:helix-turn-helix domain-containing protein [Sphingomonas sp. SRS2]KKC27426.1 hypothetical protein WP12_03360 [Sphingomonas sp. SRS2]